MFVNSNKLIPYPAKTIEEEMLSAKRDSAEAFVPFDYGTAFHVVEAYVKNRSYDNTEVLMQQAVEYVKSSVRFDPERYRPTGELDISDNGQSKIDSLGRERRVRKSAEISDDEIEIFLEKIRGDSIRTFIGDVVSQYVRSTTGLREAAKANYSTGLLVDEEDAGVKVQEADILEDKSARPFLEREEAEQRLPYLLKQIHNWSIRWKASVMSFIICREKALGMAKSVTLTPATFYAKEQTWRMSPSGEFAGYFWSEDNKGNVFRKLMAWVTEQPGKDADESREFAIVWRYYEGLRSVCNTLNIELAEEDSREFTDGFIRSAVCTYLASNMEYLEESVYGDTKVLNLLTPDRLFRSGLIQDEDEFLEECPDDRVSATLQSVQQFVKVQLMGRVEGFVPDRIRCSRVLDRLRSHGVLDCEEKELQDYGYYEGSSGLLYKPSGTVMSVKADRVICECRKARWVLGGRMLITTGGLLLADWMTEGDSECLWYYDGLELREADGNGRGMFRGNCLVETI